MQVLEFCGCFIHGHRCPLAPSDKGVGGKNSAELYASFQQRIELFRHYFKCEIVVQWECEFDALLAASPRMQSFMENMEFVPPLNPRLHALRGGRVEPFQLLHECNADEELLFFDIVSGVVKTK